MHINHDTVSASVLFSSCVWQCYSLVWSLISVGRCNSKLSVFIFSLINKDFAWNDATHDLTGTILTPDLNLHCIKREKRARREPYQWSSTVVLSEFVTHSQKLAGRLLGCKYRMFWQGEIKHCAGKGISQTLPFCSHLTWQEARRHCIF